MVQKPIEAFLIRIAKETSSSEIATAYSDTIRVLAPVQSADEAKRTMQELGAKTALTEEELAALDRCFVALYCSAKYRERAKVSLVKLDRHEREALLWCAQGKHSKEIATEMGKGKSTVELYLKTVKEKLKANTMAEAVQRALVEGIIGPEDLLTLRRRGLEE